jgi:flagellar biosynthesis protein FlhB
MPGDAGEKTEAPTPRRREEARQSGQIAHSPDLQAAVVLLGAIIALNAMGGRMLKDLLEGIGFFLGRSEPIPLTTGQVTGLGANAVRLIAKVSLPVMLIAMVLGVATALAQVGWLFTTKPLQPRWDKLNPIAGASRLFSTRGLVRLGMSVLKLMVVGTVAYVTIKSKLLQIVHTLNMDHWALFGMAAELVFSLAIRMALVLLILAILDYAWQRYRLEEDLKMSKEEVKEEMRRMEGDPIIKQRQRRVQQQLSLQRMRHEVPKADVVVTNPTELAIAIKYDADSMGAPRVVAKGQGFIAAQIRHIAIQHGVPIVERKPLAQALYRLVEVGEEIPPQFYKAVAEILAYVYELTGKGPRPRKTAAAG